MIPASHVPYEARYRHENNGHTHFTTKPVVAWGDDFTALVVDAKAGRLREADSWTDFADVTLADSPVVGVLPGGGWRVEYRGDEGEESFSHPVLAWHVHADGGIVPIGTDLDGFTADPTTDSNFARLFHPEEEQE